MASNQFGNLFRITTWGESHGKAIGVVIDGCPAGLPITAEEIDKELFYRRPGTSIYTSPRKEEDRVEILSGLFEGVTTGTPISLLIYNLNVDSTPYEKIRTLYRPGHAHFTYLEKYGIYDHRGAGRASARETTCRVAAGAVAKKLLLEFGIEVAAFVTQIGEIEAAFPGNCDLDFLREATRASSLYCPDKEAVVEMQKAILRAKEAGDSLGGIVEMRAEGLPPGLGDPIYEKLEASLAKGLLSIPACKGFEIGSGFAGTKMMGSEHNDRFETNSEGAVVTATNHCGGVLGGISNGMPLTIRCAFKPPSSIRMKQKTLDLDKQKADFILPEGAKHDPCVAIRAVPVVEAMGALVLADALLMNRSSKLFPEELTSPMGRGKKEKLVYQTPDGQR